ncbi:serglycin [Aulostomus maculatus]
MKFILFFIVCNYAIINAHGAPATASYKFVRCLPDGNQANCQTQKSPDIQWTPDLPVRLPASTAESLGAEPEQGEETKSLQHSGIQMSSWFRLNDDGSGNSVEQFAEQSGDMATDQMNDDEDQTSDVVLRSARSLDEYDLIESELQEEDFMLI